MTDNGRVLLQNLDGVVRHEPPFVLVCECHGHALDLAIRRVSLFAFVLAAIIATIVLLRVAPWLIGLIAIFWILAASFARFFARRRRREHGRFVIDFERDILTSSRGDGVASEHTLGKGTTIRVETSVDAQAPFWIIVNAPDGRRYRIARGRSDELLSLLQLFRSYNYDVDRRAIDINEPNE